MEDYLTYSTSTLIYNTRGNYSYTFYVNPLIEWFRKNRIEELFIRNLQLFNSNYSNGETIIELNKDTIINSFPWDETDEGYDFWENINTDYINTIQTVLSNESWNIELLFDPTFKRFVDPNNNVFFRNNYGDYLTTGFGTEWTNQTFGNYWSSGNASIHNW